MSALPPVPNTPLRDDPTQDSIWKRWLSALRTDSNATVTVADGGTGITSYTIGDLIYASAATTLSKLADVAVGQVLVSGGVGVAPAWSGSPTLSGSLTIGSLTSGRVPFASTGGLLADDSGFTFNTTGDILTVGAINVAGTTAPTSGWYLPSADLIRTPNSVTVDDNLVVSGTAGVTGNGTFSAGLAVQNSSGTAGVSNDFSVQGTRPTFKFFETDVTDLQWQLRNDAGSFLIQTQNDAFNSATTRVTVAHTTGNVTLTGDLAVNGGDLTSSATTFNLLNATVTTLNIGGAATATRLGAATSNTAVNTTVQNYIGVRLGGTMTSGGASILATQVNIDGTVTGAIGDTNGITMLRFNPTIVTQGNSETIGVVATAHFQDPNITVGTGDAITVAATLYIANAPTEGATNDALHVAAGTSRFLGNVITNTILSVSTTATVFNTVATTVNAFGAASVALNIGNASGTNTVSGATTFSQETTCTLDLNVNGGDLKSSATTFNLLNATVTTLNVASAAGSIIGIGGSGNNSSKVIFSGSLTCGNASSLGSVWRADASLTASASQTSGLTVISSGSSSGLITPNTGMTLTLLSAANFYPPIISKGASDTITNTATVYIDGANTEGSNNYAVWVNDGSSRFDGIGSFGTTPSTTTTLNLAAGTTSASSIRLAHGSAPTSPVDGDMWTTTAGLYVRINGATVGPLT